VIGMGGVFFRADDPERLYVWYEEHLGLRRGQGFVVFPWRQAGDAGQDRMTVWSLFPRGTDYFGPTNPAFMVNYIVEHSDGMLAELRAKGAAADHRREDSAYGRFAWVTDLEGNRIELWQPPR
jgi:hypothetical protein